MRFRVRLILLSIAVIITISGLLASGWSLSKQFLQSIDVAYQQGEQLSTTIDQARAAQVNFQRQVQEWKDILLRGSDPMMKLKYWEGFQQRERLMNDGLTQVNKSLLAMGMDNLAQEALDLMSDHVDLGDKYRAALAAHPALTYADQQAIDAQVKGIDRPTSAGIDKLVAHIQAQVTQHFESQLNQVKADSRQHNQIILIASLIVTIVLVLLMLSILRSLLQSLGTDPEDAVVATARIATGDLTERLNATNPASLIGALEVMQMRLRNISLAIKAVSHDITVHASTLPDGIERQNLAQDVINLHEAIDRIKVDREGGR